MTIRLVVTLLVSASTAARASTPDTGGDDHPTIGVTPVLGDKDLVNDTGAFVYRVPIDLPPGRANVAPKLSLAYSSSQGNGLLGMGFVLQGLPAISRLPFGRPVAYDGHDVYVFQPNGWATTPDPALRLVTKTNGRSHAYQNRGDAPFGELEAKGTCGDGPCYWILRDGRGLSWYFGGDSSVSGTSRLWEPDNGVHSHRGVAAWALHKVEDQHGNFYDVTYYNDNRSIRPRAIVYTKNGATTGFHTTTVSFEYATRPDVSPMPGHFDQRMTMIMVDAKCIGASCQHVRTYRLNYHTSGASGRSRMDNIVEEGTDRRTSRPAQVFKWTDSGATPSGDPFGQLIQYPHDFMLLGAGDFWDTHVGDINGDGRADVIRVFQGDTTFNETRDRHDATIIQFALASWLTVSGTNWFDAPTTHTNLSPNGNSRYWRSLVADINGDGRDDLVLYILRGDGIQLQFALGARDGLGPLTDWAFSISWPRTTELDRVAWSVAAGDINGDQRTDLVFFNSQLNRLIHILGQSYGPGQPVEVSSWTHTGTPVCDTDPLGDNDDDNPCVRFHRLVVQDFDGDGTDDVLALWASRHLVEWYGDHTGYIRRAAAFGSATAPLATVTETEHVFTNRFPFLGSAVGDMNGDRRADVMMASTGFRGVPAWNIDYASIYGRDVRAIMGEQVSGLTTRITDDAHSFPYSLVTPGAGGPPDTHPSGWQYHLADMDGDGISDVVQTYRGSRGTKVDYVHLNPTGTFGVDPNTNVLRVGIDDPTPRLDFTDIALWRTNIVDLNGDGNADLVFRRADYDGVQLQYILGTSSTANRTTLFGSALRDHTDTSASQFYGSSWRFPDINGDGKSDVIVASNGDAFWPPQGRMHFAISVAGMPDLLRKVENGYGATTTAEYAPTAATPYAILHRSTTGTGVPDNTARSLVSRITIDDGRGFISTTDFSYSDGRVRRGTPELRENLGFASITRTHAQTGRVDITTYRQDPPFARLPMTVEVHADPCAGTGTPCPKLMSRHTTDYAATTPYPGIVYVGTKLAKDETFELGRLTATSSVSYTRDPTYGVVTGEYSCTTDSNDACVDTRNGYTHATAGWLIGRLDSSWTTRKDLAGRQLVLDMRRATYDPVHTLDPVLRERILFPDSLTAICTRLGDPAHDRETCANEVSAGKARWVPVEQDIRYDSWGNVSQSDDAYGNTTQHTYDADQLALEATTTDPLSHTVQRFYDAAGHLTTTRDPNNQPTTTYYDPLGRASRRVPPGIATPELTKWEYLDDGRPGRQRVVETVYRAAGVSHRVERFYDGLGFVYQIVDHSDLGDIIIDSLRFYDATGHLIVRRTLPHFATDPIHYLETRHDQAGRVELVRRTDSQGRVEKELTGYTYSGATSTVRDAEGRSETRHVSARGLVTSLDDAAGQTTSYFYDPRGQVLEVQQPVGVNGGIVRTLHDSWGRKTTEIDQSATTWRFAYDDLGNLTEKRDGGGHLVTYQYDADGRLQFELHGAAQAVVASYFYDQPGHGSGIGRLTSIGDRSGATSLSYDVRGNITRRELDVGLPQTYIYGYLFDQTDHEIDRRFPVGHADEVHQVMTYANDSVLKQISHDGTVVGQFAEHNARRQVGRRDLWLDATGVASEVTHYSYDDDELLAAMGTVNRAGSLAQNYVYAYDRVGNVKDLFDRRNNVMVGGVSTSEEQHFSYDARNRLRTASGIYGARTYDYDPMGNITAHGPVAIAYASCSATARCLTGSTGASQTWKATHDAAGNRIEFQAFAPLPGPVWKYTWDDAGHLMTVAQNAARVAELTYDHAGQRAKKVATVGLHTVTTHYLGDAYELRESSALPGQYATTIRVAQLATIDGGVRLPGQLDEAAVVAAATRLMSGTTTRGPAQGTRLHLANHIGTFAASAQAATGLQLLRLIYEPFGALVANHSVGADANVRKFSGKELDEETGLVYYGARYYDPITARFLTPDDRVPAPGENPQQFNRYAYAVNNPVRYSDPTGHVPADWADDADRWIQVAQDYYSGGDENWVRNASVATIADIAHGTADLLRLGATAGSCYPQCGAEDYAREAGRAGGIVLTVVGPVTSAAVRLTGTLRVGGVPGALADVEGVMSFADDGSRVHARPSEGATLRGKPIADAVPRRGGHAEIAAKSGIDPAASNVRGGTFRMRNGTPTDIQYTSGQLNPGKAGVTGRELVDAAQQQAIAQRISGGAKTLGTPGQASVPQQLGGASASALQNQPKQ